ncbi:hypothetical protein RBU55_30220 [Pseudomonas chlororaphis subsp. aurantiaca]|uniref:hypothetical protein n=1 Tax=Pseudomonas chlororaphis TaxID=587753 RepID=UPI0027DCF756|nr:hypothetical protein [Pseudomonas chlororaphis]WMI99759.1 hypothetical protein RBU55_30220 [Pseudomonas chlororaphis subsp. aurantiaca]
MSSMFEKDLTDVKKFIATGGGASEWFAKAYASWYWETEFWKVNLNGYQSLDSSNKKLFMRMINLRMLPGWTDHALHEVALFAVKEWDLLPHEVK